MRGTALMAISNKFGGMVLTTGNKSEMSVGYATLYGDMNGGFNPIKDLYKMEVYRLVALAQRARAQGRARGRGGHRDPREHHHQGRRPPSCARTRPTRTSLPPYEVLDDILACLVEQEMPLAEIVARGHAPETVKKVERLLYIAEYKRRQAAPGVKISAAQLRPRPPLSHHQQVPRGRSRPCQRPPPHRRPERRIAASRWRRGGLRKGRAQDSASPGIIIPFTSQRRDRETSRIPRSYSSSRARNEARIAKQRL